MRAIRSKLSYANVISTLCLFLLLGGGAAFAASKLGKNSVGTAQLKNGAVTAAKVQSGSLLASNFAAGQLPAGPQGAKGEAGKEGREGEPGQRGVAGERGEPGQKGEQGEAAAVTTPLKSGETMTGFLSIEQTLAGGDTAGASASFPTVPPNPIPETDWHLTESPTTECPGIGEAAPGELCLWVTRDSNAELPAIYNESAVEAPIKHGFWLQVLSESSGLVLFGVVWAYTAP